MQCYENLPLEIGKRVKLCPVDKEEVLEMFQDRCALLDVIKLHVYCYFKNQGCTWVGTIFHFLNHVQKECKFGGEWKTCEFSIIGCEKKGEEKMIDKHHAVDIGLHVDLLGRNLTKNANILEQASSVCESILVTDSECLKQLAEDFDGIIAVSTYCDGLEARIQKASKDIKGWAEDQSVINTQCLELKRSDINIVNLHSISRNLFSKFESLNIKAQDIENNDSHLPSVTIITNSAPANINTNLGPKLKRLERDRKTRKESLADTDLRIRLFQATTTDGRYMWRIDNYPRRMKEAIEGKIVELYSPPLFSDVFGYKVCCKIFLNGKPNEAGHGTHIAFYMILMKGEFDDLLRFPFPRIFRATLLAHAPRSNVEKIIEPTDTEEFQKPSEDMNPIVGHSKFISHKDLSDAQYLWGDSLFFKINFTERSARFSYDS